MDLLELARGPGLAAALAIFLVGTAWRLACIFRRPSAPQYSRPRRNDTFTAAWRSIWIRMLPRREYGSPGLGATLNAYGYHLALALIVLAFAPHIAFIARLSGMRWPALPDAVTYVATAAAIACLLIALVNRLSDPVLRLLSGFDDYFSWFLTMLPLATGMALIERPYVPAPLVAPPLPTTPEFLALHLFSLELLLVWLPFGKLFHAVLVFVSRAKTGAELGRKGAAP